ncbi:MAG: TonB-dependent receptor [Saprospiraceae bacterium]|nr:TonB-dependent receptor [Saprospiraceae bacterium]
MRFNIYYRYMLLLLAMVALSSVSWAQTELSGTVTDDAGEPLIGANVTVKGTTQGAVTDLDGNFGFSTSASLPLTLVVSYTGYSTQEVAVSNNSPVQVQLLEGIFTEQVVVSASRKREKIQEAPASISVLSARKLEGTPQTDAVRNLVNVPGVQIQQQSAARINIEMRASSGLFGTSAFPIMDYRSLIGPGIGTFQSDQSGIMNIDLERIEVVRGPGSALYGPGVTSGVIHFITKNPIDHPGTTIQVGGGELSTFLSAVRHAGANENKTFGYKINATYNRGNEFTLDPDDPDDAAQIANLRTTIVRPAVSKDRVDLTQPGTTLLTMDDLDPDGDGNPMQADWWNASFNGHLEFRPQDDLSVTVAAGYNTASSVFYNDLGEGLAQANEYWTQARMQKGGLFAQIFYVDNDGGKEDNPTFLYQTGNMSSVGRKQIEGQLQYNIETPNFLNADWTFGVDYRQAISSTNNLTYGRFEADDDYRIFGGYLQGKFAVSPQLDILAAGRYDDFNILDEGFFSPRLALVWKPDPKHTFRATYNRAGAPPGALVYNIDFPVNAPVPGLFDFWLAGQRELHEFSDNPMIDVTIPGVPDLPFGTPGLPLAVPFGAVNDAVLAGLIPALEANPQTAALAPFLDNYLRNQYTPGGFTGTLVGVNAFENNTLLNELIPTNEATVTINNTLEFGYKGLFADKFGLSVDVYNIKTKGFSDFTQIGPLITLQGSNVPGDLGAQVQADITPVLIGALTPALGAEGAAAAAAQIAPLIGGAYSAGGQGFDDQASALYGIFGAVESSLVPQGDGIVHVPAGYRIFPDAEASYWGIDLAMEYYFSNDLSAWFNYSYVSDTEFRGEELGEPADSPLSIFFNAPKNKYRVGLNYTPEFGFRANVSFQHDDSFFASVGQYTGDTDVKDLVDMGVGYAFDNGLTIDVSGQNIFNNEYRAFANMPRIGRRVVARLTYTFGNE